MSKDSEERASFNYDTSECLITVFTATYNRATTLPRVYESLRAQTVRNFEWLIVDDGSTDQTSHLVHEWIQTADFPIRCIRQVNQGKHIASNRGALEAKGELFLSLDSDDGCVATALETFERIWKSIPEDIRQDFSAVTALCQDQYGNVVGEKFPRDVLDSDSLELRYRFKVKGEKWGFQRTDIMRKFLFPQLPAETFVPENVVWDAIARHYKTRFVNVPLRIYWIRCERDNDAGARSLQPRAHARGHAYAHRWVLNNNLDWFRYAPWQLFRSGVHYVRFSFHAVVSVQQQYQDLTSELARTIWAVSLPVGWLMYSRDRLRSTADPVFADS